jgi:hypothetical protein
MLEILSECETWAMDGTFKSCPKNFKQVFVIGGFVGAAVAGQQRIVIAAHAFLPGKQTQFYEEALSAISEEIQPKKPMQGWLI